MGMAITALVFLVIAKGWQWWGNVPLLAWSWQPALAALGVGLGCAISLASLGLYFVWPAYRASAESYLNLVLRPLELADLVWLGLLPGLSEELLFRGVMLPSFGSGAIAVLLSGASFGVLHMSGRSQWPYAVWATLVGIFLGAIALLTGNLLVPVATHVTANLVSALFWKLRQSPGV
ncbi:MAG: CPBP family intramembrane metalloprotease [Synechococcales cyanobacterium CRU_2_2]|nr:CPBP family intramembrane metalloprotease [Synechococcales cyanobacterium CRU_2_2]